MPTSDRQILRAVLAYIVIAGLWIAFSDLALFTLWPQDQHPLWFNTAKGIGFVLFTAVLLYLLLHYLKRAESRARRAEGRTALNNLDLLKLMHSFPAILYACSERNQIVTPLWVSDNVQNILGYKPEEVLEEDWWSSHLHPEDAEASIQESQRIMQAGGGRHEYRIRDKSGVYHHIQDELQILRPGEGDFANSGDAKYVGVWTDITARYEAEQRTLEYARQLTRTMQDTVNAVIKMLELRDPYTAGHSRRVGELSAAIASELGYDEDSQEGLRIAGLLHDIGKVGVPGEILTKPTRLTDGEFHLVKEHVDFGYQTLKDIDFPWPVADIVLQHHERMNGSGYPSGLRGDEIMMQARIVAVADVIESMASHRPYRPSRGINMALEEIEHNAGDLYDKKVVAACLKLFREKAYELPV